MLKRSFNDKRGVTPVLSSLLLTVVAVAVMAIATTATYVITSNLHDAMGERLIIEDVWFDSTTTNIYLRNTGKVPIQITAVYINHDPFPQISELEIGQHRWLNISKSCAPGFYYLDVVSARGTHVADYYRAP